MQRSPWNRIDVHGNVQRLGSEDRSYGHAYMSIPIYSPRAPGNIVCSMTDTYVQQILYGVLLGDGWLQTQNSGKTYRFRYEQGDLHKEYMHHVYDILQEWCAPPRLYIRYTASGTQVRTWRLQSRTHTYFSELAPCLYRVGVRGKHISSTYIQQYISPIGIAYWYMDDGSLLCHNIPRRYGLCFHTQGFTVQESLYLVHGLQEKYGLECWVKYNKSKPCIAVSGRSYTRFLQVCGAYIHPSIYYKLPCHGTMLMT